MRTNRFLDLEKAFAGYKKKAGATSYVACFGKTFLDPASKEYMMAETVAEIVIDRGFGVIHGAYTGAMEASSRGAERGIRKDKNKNKYWNIGVPMKVFDRELSRASIINLPAAKDISDRKKALLEFCDACIVLPAGGIGTMLESLEIFHMNQIAEKFGGKIRPLIFVAGNWRKIFDQLFRNLDMNKQKRGESFIYFVDTLKEVSDVLEAIKTASIE